MPRGVYDRKPKSPDATKTKAPKAPKTVSVTKKKPGPQPGFKKTTIAAPTARVNPYSKSLSLADLHLYFTTLTQAKVAGINSKVLDEAISNTICRMEVIAEGMVPLTESSAVNVVESQKVNGKKTVKKPSVAANSTISPGQVLPAPTMAAQPFIPASANGS